MVHEIEKFFGVYLLYCVNPRYKGRTYIGFTVNPNRRIGQHNKGSHAGGAKRTSGRGPWDMVLIVHGFPNQISALRFEWAWQQPKLSRRLKHLPLKAKRKNETPFNFCLRVLSHMLRVAPWTRLPLTIRWLKQEYQVDFDPTLAPPLHMPFVYGPVKAVDAPKQPDTAASQSSATRDEDELPDFGRKLCAVCYKRILDSDKTLKCLRSSCRMESHIICLARRFSPDHILPIEGECPECKQMLLWGDLVRFKRGCYQNLVMGEGSGEEEEDYS